MVYVKREFDPERAMRAQDRLFKEIDELKVRVALLEKLLIVKMKELCDERANQGTNHQSS